MALRLLCFQWLWSENDDGVRMVMEWCVLCVEIEATVKARTNSDGVSDGVVGITC